MQQPLRLATAGIGNNISALLQGVFYYRDLITEATLHEKFPGIRNNKIGNLFVGDIDFVCGFDIDNAKLGLPLAQAVFTPPNNYIDLGLTLSAPTGAVSFGLTKEGAGVLGKADVVRTLRESNAEVLLYSLPTGLQWAAEAYADCALEAGVGFVNCTPEVVARNPEIMKEFEKRGLPLIGDDLASHMGTSMLHREILNLLIDRGLDLESTYQLNIGGNEDFKNLRDNGKTKAVSKKNALARKNLDLDRVEIVPSAGFIPSLKDRKVAYVNVKARGWANTEIAIDLKLEVQDSSNAAGVITDLIRIAGVMKRRGEGGFNAASASFLKSPPLGHETYGVEHEHRAFAKLNAGQTENA